MRHVGPTRVELGTRTIFNLLGPLSNPAGVKRQLVGVYAPQWIDPLAEVLRDLGSESVWVVHGEGLDEITTTGITKVAELKDGKIRSFELTPNDFGLARTTLDALKGGDGAHNAAALQAVLDGEENAYRDISLANAAASLMIAGRAKDLAEGMAIARQALSSGAAKTALQRLITVSNAA
jgi:anthranilate phosphoribosyltransferase